MADIKPFLNKIKSAVFGKDVRGSLHDGLEAVNKETEDATALSKQTEHRQDSLDKKYDEQIANMTNSNPDIAELVDYRVSGFTGKSYSTAGKRADAFDKGLAKAEQDINSRGIHINNFGAIGDGKADDTQAFKDALSSAHDTIYISGEYKISESIILNKKSIISYKKSSIMSDKDINIIEMREKSNLVGIDVHVANNKFSKAAIRLNGKYNPSSSKIMDVTVKNISNNTKKGIGIELAAIETLYEEDATRIVNTNIINVQIAGFDIGILFNIPNENADFEKRAYINGNNFNNIWISNFHYGFWLDGINNNTKAVDGNHFVNINLQYSPSSRAGGVCYGQRNVFNNIQFWDMGGGSSFPDRTEIAIDFRGNAKDNIVITPEKYERFFYHNKRRNYVNYKIMPYLPLPRKNLKEDNNSNPSALFSTMADNVLYFADKNHNVDISYSDGIKEVYGIDELFSPFASRRARYDNVKDDSLITIDVKFKKRIPFPRNFFINFSEQDKEVHVEAKLIGYSSIDSNINYTETTIYCGDTLRGSAFSDDIDKLYADSLKVKIKGSNLENERLYIYNLFLDSGDFGSLYPSIYGNSDNEMQGNLYFSDNRGPVLYSVDGTKYKIYVKNNGDVGTIKLE